MEAAMEADADDVVTNEDGSIDVFTSFTGFYAVRNALEAPGSRVMTRKSSCSRPPAPSWIWKAPRKCSS
jgi:transcriptional/translational regulatory protein YebC/TACO1